MVLLYLLKMAGPRDINVDATCEYHQKHLGHSSPLQDIHNVGRLSSVVFQWHQIHCPKDESWNSVGKLISHLIQPSFYRSGDSFREEMGFAKGRATSEIGSTANYGCQTQLGYQGDLSTLHLFEIIFLLIPCKILPNAIQLS